MQKSKRAGKLMEDLGDMGTVQSKIGGSEIKIADEFASHELNEIIESSSLLATEGVKVLENAYKNAKDHQGLVKNVIKYFNKANTLILCIATKQLSKSKLGMVETVV